MYKLSSISTKLHVHVKSCRQTCFYSSLTTIHVIKLILYTSTVVHVYMYMYVALCTCTCTCTY